MSSDLSNGVSRRNFMRILGAASAAATSFPALAAVSPQTARRGMGGDDMGSMPARNADTVIISSNENPLGPSQVALSAISTTAAIGGRYHQEESQKTIAVFTDLFALPKPKPREQGYAALFPGSGGPLDLALMSNIGPDKPLVYGDPSYEQGPRAADTMKAPQVPGAADRDLCSRREGDGGSSPLARRLLHREPEQPDRHDDSQSRHRLAAAEQAEGFGRDRR